MLQHQSLTKPVQQRAVSTRPLTLAVSAKWHTFPQRLQWIAEQGFALEYTPNLQAFHTLPQHLEPLLHAGVRVRHHGFFPGYEIGDVNPEQAERAMQIHLAALDAMRGYGEQVITLHMGLTKGVRIDPDRVVKNLAHLVAYGKRREITVSLENLKHGLTSRPETVYAWAEQSGAQITLDVGHALSSEAVVQGRTTVHDIIDRFADRLIEVHFYEKESDRHHAPRDMRVLGPVADHLLKTECAWWTIELDDFAEILQTRILFIDHIVSQHLDRESTHPEL